jgi:amidase
MPTEFGSPLWTGRTPRSDAAAVARLRSAGAVIMGKTVTTEYAYYHPGKTRNPHDPARTPGGSSSGSAAAVADRMVYIAFGTQTGGSVLRPASFCGVVGYKPIYNIISRGGMKFAAESRDTIGLFARTVEDVDLVASVLTGRAPAKFHDTLPKIALCRTHLWDNALPESKHAVEDAAKWLNVTGEATLPPEFAALAEARTVINPFERARALAHEWNTNPALISPGLTAQIEKGLAIPHARYTASLQRMKECRDLIPALFGDADILLAPCVTGEAPKGLETTGEPMFQEFWTALHVPTITLPTHRGPNGLPIGIQLVARHYEDEALLAFAKTLFERLSA